MMVRVLIQALSLMLLSRVITPTEFGYFVVVSACGAVLSVLSASGAPYVLLKAWGSGCRDLGGVLGALLIKAAALGSIFCVVYFGFSFFLFGKGSPIFIQLLGVFVSEVLIIPLANVVLSAYQASGRVSFSQKISLIIIILRFCVIAGLSTSLMFVENKITVLSFGILLVSIIYLLIVCFVGSKSFCISYAKRDANETFMIHGKKNMWMHLVNSIGGDADKFISARLAVGEVLGFYNAASRLVGVATAPATALILNVFPVLYDQTNSSKYRKKVLIYGCVSCFLLGLISLLCLLLLGRYLIALLDDSYVGAVEFVYVLSYALPFIYLRHFLGAVTVSSGLTNVRILIELFGVMVVCAYPFIPALGDETVGTLAFAVVYSEFTMALLFVFWVIRTEFKVYD